MFNLFNKQISTEESEEDIKEEESAEESEEESEESEESEEDIKEEESEEENYFLRHVLYKDEYKTLYKTDARDFVPEIKIWAQQRPVNKEHVKKLEESVLYEKHVKGNMKLLRDTNGDCRLIDGQHRYYALKNIMENDSKFNIPLILEVYETDCFESEKSVKIFKEVNNCLNINLSNLPNIQATNILCSLTERFPKIFVDVKESRRVNRPRINKRNFYIKLKEYFIDSNCNEKDLLKQILEKNKMYGMRGRKGFKAITNKMYEKSKKSGFYLGLDKNFNWMNYLDWN